MSTNTLEQTQSRPDRRPPVVRNMDLTRGAVHFGIRHQRVLLASEVIEDYREIDGSLGYNAAGQILSVLARHIALAPGGGGDDTFSVLLQRREDAQAVKVQLAVVRSRRHGQACLVLHQLAEHEFESKP